MNTDKFNQRIKKLPGEIFDIISQIDQIKGRRVRSQVSRGRIGAFVV